MDIKHIKQFLEHPHEGFDKLAFAYRQAMAQRQQSQQKLAAAQQALAIAQQEMVRASAYEKGLLDAIESLEVVLCPPPLSDPPAERVAPVTCESNPGVES